MTSLMFVTQLADPDDPGMGFTANLVRGLSSRFDRVWVIANEMRRPFEYPGVEMVSLGKERGAGRASKALALSRMVAKLGKERQVALLAHQCPIYLNVAAPAAKWRGTPMLLWFAHPSVTPSLRIAEAATGLVVTSLPGAFPIPSKKLHVIGQAIDVGAFSWQPIEPSAGLRIVAIGRTSPSKGFGTLIDAMAILRRGGVDVSARIVGPSLTDAERRHRQDLRSAVDRLGLADAVAVEDGLPPVAIPWLIGSADVLVNAMVAGSGDKVVFEAAATGRPVIVSNPSFAELLDGLEPSLRFPEGDARALADRIAALAELEPDRRVELARELRSRVERGHSLEHWSSSMHELAARSIASRS